MTSPVFTPQPGKCNAPNPKRGGKLCMQPAGAQTDHLGVGPCKWHGGTLPVVKKAWAGRLVEHEASRALAKFGKPVKDVDPEQALLDLVAEAAGNVAWLGHVVSELAAGDGTEGAESAFGPTGRWSRVGGDYVMGRGLFGPIIDVDKDGGEHVVGEQERAMVKLYGQWSDRLAKYAKAALDAGIEKRRVEMAERQGETIVVVINNVLVRLGLDSDKIVEARRLIAEEFRSVEAQEVR